MTLEEKISMIRGYIFAKGWEQAPTFVDQMGCTDHWEEYRQKILGLILDATEKKESFLDVYKTIKKMENEQFFDDENDFEIFNKDSRDQIFGHIDDILKDVVTFKFFHTSPAGMIDVGNYEALNGRGEQYNENLRNAKQPQNSRDSKHS